MDATRCAPKLPVIYEGLGFALQKQNKLPEAIAQYDKAMQLKPSQTTQKAIDTCKQNIEIAVHNKEMEALDAAQTQAEKEEADRIAAEEAKRAQWEKERQKDD